VLALKLGKAAVRFAVADLGTLIFAAISHASDDERGWWHVPTLLGDELAAQRVGLAKWTRKKLTV
jgi:hypothetical protein